MVILFIRRQRHFILSLSQRWIQGEFVQEAGWRRQIKEVHQIPTPAFIAKAAKHFNAFQP